MAGGRAGLSHVVLLSGGTGGAKLARGLLDVCHQLTVVANTGDDVEVHGVHVSPDPDLVTYWLADAIHPRGWGLRGDTSEVMDALRAAGRPVWFHLGDRDLAMCLVRTAALRAGRRLTEAQAEVADAMGVAARVLPMSDEPVRTHVRHGGRVWPFQEYMIVAGAAPPVEGVTLEGISAARPTAEVLAAVASCDLIVIGPSNPVTSIGPILALPGMREAVAEAPAPVLAVSPFVEGRVLKGPTEHFCEWAGVERSARGIAGLYAELLDGLVADEPVDELPCLVTSTLMDTAERRQAVAREVVSFGERCARSRSSP
ncbi:MAG TPA: 2-phospho-L-lactate transferase [Thermoleophilaceae bacterium]|nr:2-phospho-L-lactate transferase [Thermoleophilaceae bacterium]